MTTEYIVLSDNQSDYRLPNVHAWGASIGQEASVSDKSVSTKGKRATPKMSQTWLPPEPKVETVSASKKDLHDFEKNPNVLEYARAIPVQLVQPVTSWEHLDIAGDFSAWGVEQVGATKSPYTGEGVNVAILDTGIDAKHEAFSGIEIIQKDFTGDGLDDEMGHGTHCAGTIFGRSVNGVRIGVAPGVTRSIVGKVIGKAGSTTANLYNAILWALDQEAHVISMSLSFDFPGMLQSLVNEGKPLDFAMSEALEAYRRNISLFDKLSALVIARRALTHGTVLIAAAGNQSKRSIKPDYELYVTPPAASEGVVSVGAVGLDGGTLKVADFSNTNPKLCGPGVDVISAKKGGGLTSNSGTSMATPHVAGVAALIAEPVLRAGGNLNSQLIVAKLLGGASIEKLAEGYDPLDVGAGVVHAPMS